MAGAVTVAPSSPAALAGEQHPLVQALRAGDQDAFRALVESHYATMKRLARSYVHCDVRAEEVVQETWLAVVRGIASFEERSALSTWIYSILVNKARRYATRESRTLPFSSIGRLDQSDPAVDPDRFQGDEDEWPGHWATPPRPWQKPDRRLLSLEMRSRLRDALEGLPERQRAVVALRDVEGMSAEEVCELMELSPENQRVLLHRGRARLRERLEPYVAA